MCGYGHKLVMHDYTRGWLWLPFNERLLCERDSHLRRKLLEYKCEVKCGVKFIYVVTHWLNLLVIYSPYVLYCFLHFFGLKVQCVCVKYWRGKMVSHSILSCDKHILIKMYLQIPDLVNKKSLFGEKNSFKI